MASKSSSPGPNATTTTPAPKQARSRKAAPPQAEVGRAGSAGGIVLEREKEKKPKKPSTASKPAPVQEAVDNAASKTPKRKPRKLNKEPTSTTPASASKDTATPIEPPTATEIEALKSRVRGLEAKVEELYKSGSLDRSGRSPRRRGKGRKSSSQQQVPTLSNVNVKAKSPEIDDDVEEIGRGNVVEDTDDQDDELVRLEGELEVARQDLAAFRPRSRRANTKTQADDDDDEEDVEDLPRDDTSPSSAGNRHVTLSGSYRIPLPASVSVDDVRNIQSGVSAAQNVARSFLEQRRAAGAVKPSTSSTAQSSASASKQAASPSSSTKKKQPASARPAPKSVSSSMEIAEVGGGKQSWSEWIGGYSVAISRAVKNIEHEAAVESQAAGNSRGAGGGGGTKKKGSNAAGKRPGVKTKMSGEQVDGLMS